jgi:hypothetical protein
VTFPLPVARIRHNRVIYDADPVLRLEHPVLPGGGSHEKPRRLRMTYDEAAAGNQDPRRDQFLDSDGFPHKTIWPRPERSA